ncbi:cytochrome B [Puniceibacterium sediminis]|uniref:Cytochrome b561 n=1 Tax=Puniceibacterium sediminis TaxID=1608407 RepID=A0A238WPG2_9RHOB|nr:cytochrome B [Puniceibacterium sediminis]SNR48298.1 cytochrome b561 [Puniceibacterium sediminis]
MTRRQALKWVHWSIVPLLVWFLLVRPSDVARVGSWAVKLHFVLGFVVVTLALGWTADYLRRGFAGPPGPKLPDWGRVLHRTLHRALIWGLFAVAGTGFMLGLSLVAQLWTNGFEAGATSLGMPSSDRLVAQVYAIELDLLIMIVGLHVGFHVWRHFALRDKALHIMAPRKLHRFL